MNKPQQEYHDKLPEKYRGLYVRAIEAGASSRKAAIRSKCLDCQCWQEAEVNRCQITRCPLWPYRMAGKAEIAPSDATI
jgi:hypothetical protein